MIDCDEIRVLPQGGDFWAWVALKDGDKVGGEGSLEGRAAAIAAAREAGGAEVLEIKRASGEVEEARTPARCRIVLEREDGSEVGELEPAPGDGTNQTITVTLVPAIAEEEARTDG